MSTITTAGILPRHDSVLLHEAVTGLLVSPDDIVVDATVGGAGHFEALLGKLGKDGVLVGIDADASALARAREKMNSAKATVHLVHDNFRNYATVLDTLHIASPSKTLFDLGWSGFQLADSRGFSFKGSEPLLMTYGEPTAGNTAADVVNSLPETELADVLYELGEERFARKIAHGITSARKQKPILTTDELVAVIEASTPVWYHTRRIHPATKTFQALRMYVNDELGALKEGLEATLTRTAPLGRIAVITFHSIEDRIVKNMFRDAGHAGRGTVVTKKPIGPSTQECTDNPRARSAKLRIFECGPLSDI